MSLATDAALLWNSPADDELAFSWYVSFIIDDIASLLDVVAEAFAVAEEVVAGVFFTAEDEDDAALLLFAVEVEVTDVRCCC